MIVETYTHEGVQVQIHVDEDGSYADPRDNDNLGTMVCWHPDYALGDEQVVDGDGRGAVIYRNGESQYDAKNRLRPLSPRSMEHLRRYLGIVREGVAILPLYLLDHSGLSLSVGHSSHADPGGWDTTMVGFIYTTHERVTELCGESGGYTDENGEYQEYHSEKWLEKQLRAEAGEYGKWLAGEVYFYIVARGTTDEDSCGGYIGDDVVREAANEAASDVAEARRDAIEKIHAEHMAMLR